MTQMQPASKRLAQLAEGPLSGHGLDVDEALELLEMASRDPWPALELARQIRIAHRGWTVHLCAIISAKTGRCSQDCKWCSQSVHHAAQVQAHELVTVEKIVAAADEAAEWGAGSFGIVTSGKKPSANELRQICRAVGEINNRGRISPCACLGGLNADEIAALCRAGCNHYNHNLETSADYYAQLVSTHSHGDRLKTIRAARAAGMQLCTGGIFGMGESRRDRVQLAIEAAASGADCFPVNFLNPVPGTPLENQHDLTPLDCLAIVTMLRFVMPTRCIRICGGRHVNLRQLQPMLLMAADGLMIGNYLTTAGRPVEDDLQMIADLGLEIVNSISSASAADRRH